jgi:hypothetical protein
MGRRSKVKRDKLRDRENTRWGAEKEGRGCVDCRRKIV